MKEDTVAIDGFNRQVPLKKVHTLVIGSGAAGLNAALQLKMRGIDDILIVTEGFKMGTSINTGSDKQTYYKLSLYGRDADSPRDMAETYFSGGGMHGDLALIESALSARAFMNLVNLGVPFPADRYGQFVGYKTDHDPRQRATSIGPYTSRDMCLALIGEIKRRGIPALEQRRIVSLVTVDGDMPPGRPFERRAAGAIAVTDDGAFEIYEAENVIFAVGGPGGMYKTSVYPQVHDGAIGVALIAGARAQNLPESQYGMASIKFRWNVSGTYMQVIPRIFSVNADGTGPEQEFLAPYFESPGKLNSQVFLKGYQWPFDSRKLPAGSSLIDLLVYVETVMNKRRVFLDYRRNPAGFDMNELSDEAADYLARSGANDPTPLGRLRRMNPAAIDLYRQNGIDLAVEPLEIAVCAQHNNGGLAANGWWESVNIAHLFPVGEVNGSHGICRPGGSALNSGQVGSIRAAEYISAQYRDTEHDPGLFRTAAMESLREAIEWSGRCSTAGTDWRTELDELRARMSAAGAHVRARERLAQAATDAWRQWRRIDSEGCRTRTEAETERAFTVRQLCFAHAVYLSAILYAVENGVGSRGSSVVLDNSGMAIHDMLGPEWKMAPENPEFREQLLETIAGRNGSADNIWVARRPVPESNDWFETAWAAFRNGDIYAT